jgi:hypothetical protein
MPIIINTNSKCWRRCGEKKLVGSSIGVTTMEISMKVIQNTKNRTTKPFLGIYPKEYRTVYNRDTCFFFLFICSYNDRVILPPLLTPPPPSPPPPPSYQAEMILPLSLILLKREYKLY